MVKFGKMRKVNKAQITECLINKAKGLGTLILQPSLKSLPNVAFHYHESFKTQITEIWPLFLISMDQKMY